MNIFVLDTDPAIAASYHCDQHLHKMILESAQMLSTVMHDVGYSSKSLVYKPAYQNHSCTRWLINSRAACLWVIKLCKELENIRLSLGADFHKSMEIIEIAAQAMTDPMDPKYLDKLEFKIFAGPPSIEIRNISVVEKYQMYYRQKHRAWLNTRAPMSYKNRPIPPFLQDLF